MLYNKAPIIAYFKVFGSKCFILNTKDNLDKFDAKSDEGIFLGYSLHYKTYGVFNKRTKVVVESLHVRFDEIFTPDIVNNDCDDLPHLHDILLNENTNVRIDQVIQLEVEDTLSLKKQRTYRLRDV